MRLVITGPPKSGKTTLAEIFGMVLSIPIYNTDDIIDMEWSAASLEVSTWFNREGPWIIEGVTVPRALRKWRMVNPELRPPPFDRLVLLRDPKTSYTAKGQDSMGKGVLTVLNELKPWIGDRWMEL